ncbi:hypothetical protein D1872_313150 [compost metagenome]
MGKHRFVERVLDGFQIFQRLAQMHHDEIGFLADDGVYRGASFGGFLNVLPLFPKFLQLVQRYGAFLIVGCFPGCPVNRPKIVQGIPALQR